ncbi:TetR/AcrR family transcriptional regulator [Paenibacillus sp. BR2-3]|uniref:TetR/AcrR family transcriptional regulator n=1 Tax=Paenibacillus sp. BR2-3 TaxID=3048494 RepID=UPI003977516A
MKYRRTYNIIGLTNESNQEPASQKGVRSVVADNTVDKKEKIIKTAMQLFAVKGSSATSMQEIAELCGMSKGSLYLVFKSKEELERSIYIYCFRMIRDPLLHEEQQSTKTPQEKLRKQIEILLNHVYELREFLQRQIQDLAGSGRTDAPEWVRKSSVPVMKWFRLKLETAYGREILPYTGDLCLLVHGMISSYVRVIFHPDAPVSTASMADHLVDIMDMVAAGLLAGKPHPLIPEAIISSWMEDGEGSLRKNPLQLIKEMKQQLSTSSTIDPRQLEDAMESLVILEKEILVTHPRRAIVQGMLSNLQSCPELAEISKELKKLVFPDMDNVCPSLDSEI